MKITLNGKEYTIKYGYAPVLKNGFISEFSKVFSNDNIEEELLFIPRALLIGLQVNHSDEFGFSDDAEKAKKEEEVLVLFGNEVDNGNLDCSQVFIDITNELISNSFLKGMLEKEFQNQSKAPVQKKARKAVKN